MACVKNTGLTKYRSDSEQRNFEMKPFSDQRNQSRINRIISRNLRHLKTFFAGDFMIFASFRLKKTEKKELRSYFAMA